MLKKFFGLKKNNNHCKGLKGGKLNRNKPENLKKASENFKKNHPELKSILFDNIHIDIIEKFSKKAKKLRISKAQLFRDIVEKL